MRRQRQQVARDALALARADRADRHHDGVLALAARGCASTIGAFRNEPTPSEAWRRALAVSMHRI